MTQQAQEAVTIIGYGTAGVNALIGLRNAGYEGAVRIFADSDLPPYSPILTSYYAGGEKTWEQCFPWTDQELLELGAEVVHEGAVIGLDAEAHLVRTVEGSYPYSKCVIATGATPTCAGFPPVEGGMYEPLVLRTMEDAQRLKAVLDDASCHHVLVSGASMVALKTLEACLNRGKSVTLVGMNPHVLDFNALPEAAEMYEAGLCALGVDLRLGQTIAQVKRVNADDGNPDGRSWQLDVTFSTGDSARFDDIAVSHGMKSNLDFITDGQLDVDRGVIVDTFMRTSNPDVYAAGDVAQGIELVSGQKRIVGIWKNAALQGQCAGEAIARELAGERLAEARSLKGSISMNTIAVKNMLFISSGTIELSPNRFVESRRDGDMLVLYIYEKAGQMTAKAPATMRERRSSSASTWYATATKREAGPTT